MPTSCHWWSAVFHGMGILIPITSEDFWMGPISKSLCCAFWDLWGVVYEIISIIHPWCAQYLYLADVTIYGSDAPLAQFMKNTCKHFTLRTTQDVAVDVLPYLLKQAHFAPELHTLEIIAPCWELNTTLHVAKLRLFDQQMQRRNSRKWMHPLPLAHSSLWLGNQGQQLLSLRQQLISLQSPLRARSVKRYYICKHLARHPLSHLLQVAMSERQNP